MKRRLKRSIISSILFALPYPLAKLILLEPSWILIPAFVTVVIAATPIWYYTMFNRKFMKWVEDKDKFALNSDNKTEEK